MPFQKWNTLNLKSPQKNRFLQGSLAKCLLYHGPRFRAINRISAFLRVQLQVRYVVHHITHLQLHPNRQDFN